MKWAGSLIRIAEHEIEGLRRRIAEIGDRRAQWERTLASLAEEAAQEAAYARRDAEAGWYLAGFREGWKLRHERALAELAAIRLEEEGARDALSKAFESLKKVEHVADAARAAERKEAARRDGAALDEMASRRKRGA